MVQFSSSTDYVPITGPACLLCLALQIFLSIVDLYVLWGISEKSIPQKTFWNIFSPVKSFCTKLCKFVGGSYPHICTNFCRFILIFHRMALIFPRVPPIVFTSGIARPLVARCGCQICRPSVFGDIAEPIQLYCLHFLDFHNAFIFKCKKKQTWTIDPVNFLWWRSRRPKYKCCAAVWLWT